MVPAWRARAARQALFKALGIPWYGRRVAPARELVSMAEEAARVATAALDLLPDGEFALVPDGEKRAPELLAEGMRSGLIAAREIVRQPLAKDADGVLCDLKQQRLVSDTAAWLCRLGLRAAEGGERARRDDVLGRLLAAIEAEKAKP